MEMQCKMKCFKLEILHCLILIFKEPHKPQYFIFHKKASLVAQLVKNLPAMQETLVGFLGWEDLLEKGKATHSSILAWRIPWTV